MEEKFQIVSDYEPTGDQPKAIDALVGQLNDNKEHLTLLGATGTGKTFTVSNVIKEVNRPILVNIFNEYFSNNVIEYMVSYYDHYLEEAYLTTIDTIIKKNASINNEIDILHHSATSALFERNDVLIVTSVSCIYILDSPEEY